MAQQWLRPITSVVALAGVLSLSSLGHAQAPPPPPPPSGGTIIGNWRVEIIPVGQWSTTWVDGYSGQSSSGGSAWSMLIPSYPNPITIPLTTTVGGQVGPNPGTQSAQTAGGFRVKFTWVGPDVCVEKLYVLEDMTAEYQAKNGNGSPGSGSATNGFHPMVATTLGGKSTGKRLRQFTASNNVVEFTADGFSANASVAVGQGTFATFMVGASYTAVPDTRSVLIMSPAIEPNGVNWGKGADGSRVPNPRNRDGSITVDSTVPWHDYIVVTDPQGISTYYPAGWQIETALAAVTTGFPTDFFQFIETNWSNSGEGTVTNHMFEKWTTRLWKELVPQEFDAAQPWPKGKTSSVKVKVKDKRAGYEAEAENTYDIRWHVPYENWRVDGPTKRKDHYITAEILTQVEITNGNVEFRWYDQDMSIWEIAAYEALAVIVGGAGDGVTAWFPPSETYRAVPGMVSSLIGYLGQAIEKYRPKPHEHSISYLSLWNEPRSTSNIPRDQERFNSGQWDLDSIHVLVPYNVTPYIADQWATDGFQGVTVKTPVAVKLSDNPVAAGDFTIVPRP